jgi:hypothetical protein
MSTDKHWGLVDPFEIDDGELDSVSRTQAFVLGVEWARFRERLDKEQRFSSLANIANGDRLRRCAERHGRIAVVRPVSPEWVEVSVMPALPERACA